MRCRRTPHIAFAVTLLLSVVCLFAGTQRAQAASPGASFAPAAARGLSPCTIHSCTPWSMTPSANPGNQGNSLQGVAVVSPTDMWAVGGQIAGSSASAVEQTLIERFNGSVWGAVPSPNVTPFTNVLSGVAAVSADDVWAVGFADVSSPYSENTLIEHWNGSAWSIVPSPNASGYNILNAVFARSSSDIWAVGKTFDLSAIYQTLVEHWNGSAWSIVPSPNHGKFDNILNGVYASSGSDAWAVGSYALSSGGGQNTLTEHWNGTAWSIVASPNPDPTNDDLYGVSGTSASDVWAVGSHYDSSTYSGGSIAMHWNGTAWGLVTGIDPFTFGATLYSVLSLAPNDVWVAGQYGYPAPGQSIELGPFAAHWNGVGWSAMQGQTTWPYSGEQYSFYSIGAASPSSLVAVGSVVSGSGVPAVLTERYQAMTMPPFSAPRPQHRWRPLRIR